MGAMISDRDGDRKASRECLPLMQSAHINIYRENTFRVTGLPVDATEKEIKKHADKLKLIADGFGQAATPIAFALDPQPTADQIREAIQRLKEPEHRLIDEFFWFWPLEFGKSAEDTAIRAILVGEPDTAYQIWINLENDPSHNFIAWHNIAVMFHLVALDWTVYHISSEVDEERETKIKNYWRESFVRWEKIATDDRVWDALKSRIRALDDPRLTTGFARRMRDNFPEALDKINAEAALRFAEQGRANWAKIHIDFMNETHQGLDDVEKTAELVLTPTRNRVLQHINTAKEESKKNPENGVDTARKLIEHCTPLQNLFELFHGRDSHHKTELFDDVAGTIFSCVVAYQKKTNHNEPFVALLKESLNFATAIDVRQRIQRNIDIGEGNIRIAAFEPLINLLKETQASKEKSENRLKKIKQNVILQFIKLSEQHAAYPQIIDDRSNDIAVVLRGISIDAHNDEKDYFTAAEAIRIAAKFAKDDELKKRIAEDLKVVEGSLQDSTCHYCGKNMAQKQSSHQVAMFGDLERSWGKVNYRHTKIIVPRCVSCCERHKKQENSGCAMWTVFILIGIVLGAMVGDGGWFFGGLVGVFFGWVSTLIVENYQKGPTDQKSINDYPRIRQLLLQGWKFGDKPGKYD
jgi:hypothetical protein